MNTFIQITLLIFIISYIGSVIYCIKNVVDSYKRQNIYSFQDDLEKLFLSLFLGWLSWIILLQLGIVYIFEKITKDW